MNEKTRLHELDSLRGLAALGIVAYHYGAHFGARPIAWLLAPFYLHGLFLVEFFFVLSGFVIARAYWRPERNGSPLLNVGDRIARLYPLHFVTLLAVGGMQWFLTRDLNSAPFIYQFNDTYHFLLNLVLLNKVGFDKGFSFNAPSWSISTEFVVNIAFLFAISLPKNVCRLALLLIFTASLLATMKLGYIGGGNLYGLSNALYHTAVGFFTGVALHKAYSAYIEGRPTSKRSRTLADALSIVTIALFLYYCVRSIPTNAKEFAVTFILFPAMIASTLRSGIVKRILNTRPLIYLGAISYSIYMVHYPLQLAIHTVSVGAGIVMPYSNPIFLAAFFVLTIAVASATYFFIEIPGKRLIKRKLGAGQRVTQTA